jgi:membrane-associated PAP2 superfamily phosphatase
VSYRPAKNWLLFSPLVVLPLAVLSEYSGLDIKLGGLFYDPEGQSWIFRTHWLASDVLHLGVQKGLVYLGALLVVLMLAALVFRPLRGLRNPLGYVLLAGIFGPLLIGWLKHSTHIYIPWDLEIFGGTRPYIRIFDPAPEGLPVGNAFPSAHASGGYAWVCLYFLARRFRPSLRLVALGAALGAGACLGIAQQVRGAHFLSHDLVTIVICWFTAFAVDQLFFRLGLFPPLGGPQPLQSESDDGAEQQGPELVS